jgi:hypothetical protein
MSLCDGEGEMTVARSKSKVIHCVREGDVLKMGRADVLKMRRFSRCKRRVVHKMVRGDILKMGRSSR